MFQSNLSTNNNPSSRLTSSPYKNISNKPRKNNNHSPTSSTGLYSHSTPPIFPTSIRTFKRPPKVHLPPLIMATTRFPNSAYKPPTELSIEPYSASDPTTFAYESTIRRWPMILTNIIDRIVNVNNLLLDAGPSEAEKLKEGKQIISQISQLKYECARDKELEPIPDDGGPNAVLYNEELVKTKAASKSTWFTTSWLFAECYLYRRLRSFFALTKHWKTYDPFEDPKQSTLKASQPAILLLATRLEIYISKPRPLLDSNTGELELKMGLQDLLHAALWGNATDLSLLPNISAEALCELQSESRKDSERVLRDDFDSLWRTLIDRQRISNSLDHKDYRIDFVLDNAGFELFTDLALADWLVTISPFATKIVFHPKDIPWFVSDVMEKDVYNLLDTLDTFEGQEIISPLVKRWRGYLTNHTWQINVQHAPVWTKPVPFWDLPTESNEVLWLELKSSDLVIFKGDLNYRKLTGDAKWPTTTSFEEAIGPLNGCVNLLSLRTCKADVVVGLKPGQEEQMNIIDSKWRINGKYGLISYAPKNSFTQKISQNE
ncbi:hypothetical protein CROQUDRAFT_76605 [Cronartium quercuum f. sp. fusiforme G11]|uniref:Sugar phosphate phosphatase n=1 Tax=Cronartium quercuum f. sp. fusiforme G11 TaxID=708437 RepID=A0A9P6NNI8_9BASI|nr:hypothetical protein CROQUDRAFT_76605 [Cronartium quercuum f. sp. fusiforme G11]